MAPFTKSLPSRTELRGFDPLEPRDPHGKWIRGASLAEDLGTVRARNPRVHLEVHPTVNAEHPTARLSLIRTAEGDRGKGHAEKAMRDLTAVADRHGTTLTLTPEPLAGDRKTSRARLTEFYKRHGFVANKGRNADYSISDSMYRPPSRSPADSLAGSLFALGAAPAPDEKPGKPPERVAAFVSKGVATATRLVGARSSSWKTTTTMPEKGHYAELGVMHWDGSLQLREDVAAKLDKYLQGGTVDDPDVFAVALHELIHSAGADPARDQVSYQDPNTADIEEGFTELGTSQHMPEFVKAMGVAGRRTDMLANGPDGGPIETESGRAKHATLAEISGRYAEPARIARKDSWGHYPELTQMAEEWVEGIANAEGDNSGKSGTPAALEARRARLVQLADEINRVGASDKALVMADQVLRALKAQRGPVDPGHLAKVVTDGWRAGISSGIGEAVKYVTAQLASTARTGERSHGYNGSGAQGSGAAAAGAGRALAAGRPAGSGAGQRPGEVRVWPGAARGAGHGPDARPAGGMMLPRPLPPRPPLPPEFRSLFDPSRHPRGYHGKFIDEVSKELQKVEAGRHPRSRAPAAPRPAEAAAKVADAVKPVADFHQYNAKFTAAQDAAAQLATQRALLAFSQKRILDALNTPPEKMTPDEIAIASRVMGRLSGSTISEHVDKLREGGVPAPVVDHVHGKLGELRADLAKKQNADAKQKIITHIAAIVAAVALTLGTMGLAIPAALAAVIAAFPALSQEFIDFKADYTTRRAAAKAAKAAKAAGPGRSLGTAALALIELRRYPELRTAETPIVSTVHRPFGSPAGPGLFHVKGLQLPAYIQNVAHAFTRTGVPESEAIRRAIGVVQDWAAGRTPNGKGHVHPDVQAAAARAIAEWEAAKAAAHGSK